MSSVNKKHVMSLLQSGMTTIEVVFNTRGENAQSIDAPYAERNFSHAAPPPPWGVGLDNNFEARRAPKAAMPMPPEAARYVYKVKKTDNIREGLAVVVDTQYGLKVAFVVEVHDAPRINVDAEYEYKWIVQVVDNTEYLQRTNDERTFQETLAEIEREKVREETIHAMSAHLPAGTNARAMFDAALARLSGAQPAQQIMGATGAVPQPAQPVQQAAEGMACR